MPRIRLTERTLDKIKAHDPSGKQVLHWDTELKGFAVLASGTTNARTFVVQRTLPDGRTRRVTVGAVNEIKLPEARARAAEMLDALRRGLDPKRKTIDWTLRAALDAYLLARKDLRPASVRVYRISIERYLEAWLNLSLRDITSEMVEQRHRSIVVEVGKSNERYKGTFTANAAMRTLRILFNFAAERIPDLKNPVRLRRQWYPEPRRERVVRAAELPTFYQSVCALPNPIARDYLLLLLFTGMRLSEAASLRWEDVDLVQRVIRVPAARTKANRAFALPMSDFVRDLLVARRALGNAKFVFPGPSKTGHIVDAGFPLELVANACGVTVTAHDLRRTFITVAESADISPLGLKALVNHAVTQDITDRYVQLTIERLREPAQRIADKLKELCGIAVPAGVARLK